MPLVSPFRALRYNPAQFPDLTALLTPPYDVISEQEQTAYYAQHPQSMIRLDFGQIRSTDTETENRYSRAAHCFADWRQRQLLVQDPTPALYPASIRYTLSTGEIKTLLGFFGLVKLEEFDSGRILPHELTFSAAKQDRLHLLRACGAHFSPIFLLTPDPERQLRPLLEQAIRKAPSIGSAVPQAPATGRFASATSSDEPRQQAWSITDPTLITQLCALVKRSPLLIADGHHRYETALAFRRESAARWKSQGIVPAPADFCLAFITASHDPGLSILPTHRVLGRLPGFDSRAIMERLNDRFSITPLPPEASPAAAVQNLLLAIQRQGQMQPTLGMICRGLPGTHVLTYSQPAAAQLDVRILQSEILEQILDLQEESAVANGQLQYLKDPLEAAQRVLAGDAQAAFFLNPTPIEAIEAIARGGGRMPRKTTYFLPKPLTGFVIYQLDPASLPA